MTSTIETRLEHQTMTMMMLWIAMITISSAVGFAYVWLQSVILWDVFWITAGIYYGVTVAMFICIHRSQQFARQKATT